MKNKFSMHAHCTGQGETAFRKFWTRSAEWKWGKIVGSDDSGEAWFFDQYRPTRSDCQIPNNGLPPNLATIHDSMARRRFSKFFRLGITSQKLANGAGGGGQIAAFLPCVYNSGDTLQRYTVSCSAKTREFHISGQLLYNVRFRAAARQISPFFAFCLFSNAKCLKRTFQ